MREEKQLNIKMPKPSSSDRILEVGCGTGRLTVPIARGCALIVGVDISRKMLKVASNKTSELKNVFLLNPDALCELPLQNASFDKVVCPFVLQHIEDLGGFFHRISMTMKPNATLVFDDIFGHHRKNEYERSLSELGFRIEQTEAVKYDERLKPLVTLEAYLANINRTGYAFRARASSSESRARQSE